MQLTIEHLAKHLPYGLIGIFKDKDIYQLDIGPTFGDDLNKRDIHAFIRYNIKPSLFPLLAITKEIEIAGEKFVPIQELKIVDQWAGEFIEDVIMGFVEVIIYNRLLSWHIDVDCLIGKGLAVNATLNNPYK